MAANGKPRTIVLDFDDLTDSNDRLDVLLRMKDRDPGFKVTLFAIPARCSAVTLARYDAHKDWIQLGIHGWRHSRHECLAWTSEETVEKVDMARTVYPFAPVFKAPNWETCDELYVGLQQAGVAIADHIRNVELLPLGMPHYIYNLRLRADSYTRMHGHIQPTAWDKGLEGDYERWTAPPVGSTYLFVTEAIGAGSPLAK